MMDLRQEASVILKRYPQGRERSALIPLLRMVQERDGHLTTEGMAEVADILGLSTAAVKSVASFYTMFHLKPKGEHVVSVCHNIACTLAGAEKVVSALEDSLGISCGETTSDGRITLERAECLAHCEIAPMIQIDYDEMVGPLTSSRAVDVVSSIAINQDVALDL